MLKEATQQKHIYLSYNFIMHIQSFFFFFFFLSKTNLKGQKLAAWGEGHKREPLGAADVLFLDLEHSPSSTLWELPGGPVARTPHLHCRRPSLIPGWGTRTPYAARHGQKGKREDKAVCCDRGIFPYEGYVLVKEYKTWNKVNCITESKEKWHGYPEPWTVCLEN